MTDTDAPAAEVPSGPPITLKCKDCEQDWDWEADEQAFFEEKGYDQPTRCKECRAQKKALHRGRGRGRGGFGGRGGGACFNCGDPSHYARDCPQGGQSAGGYGGGGGGYGGGYGGGGGRGGGGNCFQCGQPGHIARDCPQGGGGGGGRGGGRGGPKGACYDHQKGQCTRGDSCKFSHE